MRLFFQIAFNPQRKFIIYFFKARKHPYSVQPIPSYFSKNVEISLQKESRKAIMAKKYCIGSHVFQVPCSSQYTRTYRKSSIRLKYQDEDIILWTKWGVEHKAHIIFYNEIIFWNKNRKYRILAWEVKPSQNIFVHAKRKDKWNKRFRVLTISSSKTPVIVRRKQKVTQRFRKYIRSIITYSLKS